MKRDDSLWKALIEELAEDFLKFFFTEADELLNFKRKITSLGKELELIYPNTQDEFNPKYVDKLIKVFTKKGKEEWILIHIEVQGSRDKHFAERMLTYFTRIRDKYHKPITALAILTDKNKKFHPTFYESRFMGNHILYEFNTYKILDAKIEDLNKHPNPFATVIEVVQTALKKGRIADDKLFDLKINLVKKLYTKNFSKKKIESILRFLKLYIRFENQDFNHKFEHKLDEITNRPKTMGIKEYALDRERRLGRKEGREVTMVEEKTIFTKNLLEQTDFTDEKIALLVGVEIDFVIRVKNS